MNNPAEQNPDVIYMPKVSGGQKYLKSTPVRELAPELLRFVNRIAEDGYFDPQSFREARELVAKARGE